MELDRFSVVTKYGPAWAAMSMDDGEDWASVYVDGSLLGPITLGPVVIAAYGPEDTESARWHQALQNAGFEVQVSEVDAQVNR